MNEQAMTQASAIQPVSNFLLDPGTMKNFVAAATYLSQSTMVPKAYQNNMGNAFVACEMAARVNLSPLMVMQQLYVVNGMPSWSGQACTALINQSRRYDKPLKVFFVDKNGKIMPRYIQDKTHGAYAYASRDGEEFYGTAVTWDLVRGEKWHEKSGSKWQTMPEQMFKYRAASFFAREHCPDILMGCRVEGEAEDTEQIPLNMTSKTESIAAVNGRIAALEASTPPVTPAKSSAKAPNPSTEECPAEAPVATEISKLPTKANSATVLVSASAPTHTHKTFLEEIAEREGMQDD